MAGRIRKSDIDEVRTRVNIADVVGQYVSLKRGGADSLKGLCPFHDEKSPSFHVRPHAGRFHCFGCQEGGDVYTFIQKMDVCTFAEAVEKAAASINFVLTYEEGGGERSDSGQRARLLEANRAAEEFFIAQLASPEAQFARDFILGRGFDKTACEKFGVGYAPNSFDALRKHLNGMKFTDVELETAGLLSRGERGVYDRFRGRLTWPIRDVTGSTLGFGARRLRDDDNGPKYLNTPESPVYHKSKALYGIDLAKRSISKERQVVVVEGYTDVMACHLAGITTAVATCGTAFGGDHVQLIRRILGDVETGDTRGRGEVIFTFDPDEAGQKAASKAFAEDSKFEANTFVAVAPEGLDPSDLRQQRGDAALRAVIETKTPLFEFIIRRTIAGFDVETVEGRVQATRAVAPVILGIKDRSLVEGYVRVVSGWIGVEPDDIRGAMRGANNTVTVEVAVDTGDALTYASFERNPVHKAERDALVALLQHPDVIGMGLGADVLACTVTHPTLAAVRDAMVTAFPHYGEPGWLAAVEEASGEGIRPLVSEFAMVDIPVYRVQRAKPWNESEAGAATRVAKEDADTRKNLEAYVVNVARSHIDSDLARQREELHGMLRRHGDDVAEREDIQRRITDLERRRRELRPEE